MAQKTVGAFTLSPNYQYGGSTATIRLYYTENFVDNLGLPVFMGAVGSDGFYGEAAVTIAGEVATVAAFNLITTEDSDHPNARVIGVLYDSNGTRRDTIFDWVVPSNSTIASPTTFAIMEAYNDRNTLITPSNYYQNQSQITALVIALLNASPPALHATSHQNGGSDEINVAGLSGLLADGQTPLAHHTSHESGGSDAIKLDNLAAPDDNTDLNASITAHGLLPKLNNSATAFLNGQGGWTTPAGAGDVSGPAASVDMEFALFDSTTGKLLERATGTGFVKASSGVYSTDANPTSGLPAEIQAACSDETTALTAGTAKITFRVPRAMTLTAVRASLSTAQTSGNIFTVDINEGGVSILSTKLTIDNGEKTSTTAATPPVISDSALADDAEITVDIDQVGDGTAKGLKISLIGHWT